MDTIGPTEEWKQKYEHEAAEVDRTRNAKASRKLPPYETAHKRGDLTDDQFEAAKKFYVVYASAIEGADVRHDDDITSGFRDPDFPLREHHASLYAFACRNMSRRAKQAVELFVVKEMLARDIGRLYVRTKSHEAAKAVGMAYVQEALDVCAFLWGISQAQRSRERAA